MTILRSASLTVRSQLLRCGLRGGAVEVRAGCMGPCCLCDDDRPGVAVQAVQVERPESALPPWYVQFCDMCQALAHGFAVKGFYVSLTSDPPNPKVKDWNVTELKVLPSRSVAVLHDRVADPHAHTRRSTRTADTSTSPSSRTSGGYWTSGRARTSPRSCTADARALCRALVTPRPFWAVARAAAFACVC